MRFSSDCHCNDWSFESQFTHPLNFAQTVCESDLFLFSLCFESTVAFDALCMLTKGEKNVLLFVIKLSFYLPVLLLSILLGTFYVGFQY